jgi:hypothetical protein
MVSGRAGGLEAPPRKSDADRPAREHLLDLEAVVKHDGGGRGSRREQAEIGPAADSRRDCRNGRTVARTELASKPPKSSSHPAMNRLARLPSRSP